LPKLTFGVHEFIDGQTSKNRESVLILDDFTIEPRRGAWARYEGSTTTLLARIQA
jgi:hypothetical protein